MSLQIFFGLLVEDGRIELCVILATTAEDEVENKQKKKEDYLARLKDDKWSTMTTLPTV